MHSPRVAVVGGGWAGFAAAVTLARHGAPVTVYEAAPVPGGRARSVTLDGERFDNGLHILLGAYTGTLDCIATVASPEAGLLRTPLQLCSDDGARITCPAGLPSPLHLAAGLLTARGLPWRDRPAALRLMARVHGRSQPCPGTVAALLDDTRQPATLRRALWEPLCIAALNTLPEEADAATFIRVLRDGLTGPRAHGDLLYPTKDLSALFPEPAARYVTARGGRVHLGEPVRHIYAEGTAFRVETTRGTSLHDRIICATDPARTPALLADLPALAPLARTINQLDHRAIVSVYLRYDVPIPALPAPMLRLSGGPAQWVFDRGRLCGQHGWLGVVISCADAALEDGRTTLGARVEAQLATSLGLPPKASRSHVIAEKRATFACTPGIERPGILTALPGFVLAGDYTASDYPGTLEAAVRSGRACARAILENR